MRQRGVTLIELIIVIVALTAGVALIGTAFVQPARSIIDNENVQITWQVAQGCADYVMGRARALYANVPVATGAACPNVPGGATGTYDVSANAGAGACTGLGATACRNVVVNASRGGYSVTLNFMFVNY